MRLESMLQYLLMLSNCIIKVNVSFTSHWKSVGRMRLWRLGLTFWQAVAGK